MVVAEKQLELGFEPLPDIVAVTLPKDTPIGERFRAFHSANGHVYLAIVSLARELKRQGCGRLGMKMIFEQLRYRHFLATRGDKWKLNNVYTAEYARLVMEQEPDLAGMFEVRQLKRRQV